jgi:putative endonuclease
MQGNWRIDGNDTDAARVSMRSLVCIEAAHNPAAAGPRVQIPPPQPNFRNKRFCCSGRCPQRQFFCTKKDLPPQIAQGRYTLRNRARKIQRSSVVERSAVNRLVVGSNPTAGAKFYVWGIYSSKSSGHFYIGHTDNLENRITNHNRTDKTAGKFTRKNGPWALGWSEGHPDRSSAMRREREIKSWKSARLIRIRLLGLKSQPSSRVPTESGLTDWS